MTIANPELREVSGRSVDPAEVTAAVDEWVARTVPESWQAAARAGGPSAVRKVRSRDEYRDWYPRFGRSGLVASTWPVEYGGLDWPRNVARTVERQLAQYHLPRLNPLGLNLAAPALFAHGTHEQRLRFLPSIVTAETIWCQLFSEPGSGSDLASLATRATKEGDEWVIHGQKIWTTWADQADFAVMLARTDPEVPKHQGISYFLIDMHQDAITPRPLRHIGGDTEFFEVFIDGALVPDDQRVGEVGSGWKVAQATLSGERQMVSGAGSGGVDRVGGGSASHLVRLARARDERGEQGGWSDPNIRSRIVHLWAEEQVRSATNQRIRDQIANNVAPGPESSIGKIHGADLNQRIQSLAAELLGDRGLAWASQGHGSGYADGMPLEVAGMLRSRANTIEGGTSEVNKNVLAERVLGLPKDYDPWRGEPWKNLPRG